MTLGILKHINGVLVCGPSVLDFDANALFPLLDFENAGFVTLEEIDRAAFKEWALMGTMPLFTTVDRSNVNPQPMMHLARRKCLSPIKHCLRWGIGKHEVCVNGLIV